jgi:hypothetical protein
VITVTTADRIDFRNWAPPVAVADDEAYAGKHRRPGRRGLALFRMFYSARHLAPER